MSLSTSHDDVRTDTPAGEITGVARRGSWLPRAIFPAGIVLTAVLFFIGAWQRRWIADDGLIVLRTVRNLLAGNGPVFNVGERVETNTSTVWTFLVYGVSWVTQARLEYVVLGIALTLSIAAIVLAMVGSGRLWSGGKTTGASLLLPAGGLVYIAVPPARDYATSGLETCLVIFWLALLWVLLIRWSQRASGERSVLVLAFIAGLGPLVRPEMLLVATLTLLLIFFAPHASWVMRVWIVIVAGLVPVGYQVWRMGYYALPYPNTAVAKDAAGSKWGQGFIYLWNLVGPYFLWLPLLILLIAAVLAFRTARGSSVGSNERSVRSVRSNERSVHPAKEGGKTGARGRGFDVRRWQAKLRSPAAIVALVLCSGLLLGLYTLRVGGDFMHGRTLLPALFCFLLPVAVLPLRLPERGVRKQTMTFAALAVAWVATMAWAVIAANTVGMATGTTIGKSGIADERAFYVLNTGHDHPILAEDYLDYPRMRAMVKTIADTPDGGLLIAAPSFTYWDVVPPPLPIPDDKISHTVYFLNLGMTSMNVPLNVRVIDQEGLAYPLAAHSDRLLDGRIGHDKALYPDWVVADLNLVDKHPWLPWYLDEDWITEAKTAIGCPETQDLLTSYRSDLTFERWKQNFKSALTLAKYRFDRVPKYEIERCKLTPPPLQRPN
ncbi:hypothetical protein [Antrihabitans cavernicola]|uniref:hypothetical protein n=1 Tax=Antrihabitans cavernicola TaxID=2495913 RepID=UPI0035305425